MQYGAHLPLIDLDGSGWQPSVLASYASTASELGYRYLTANDHLTFSRPWLDGLVALSSVVGCSGEMELVTSVSLPVVRGPANLAKSAVALDILSGGRLILGVGPGSSGGTMRQSESTSSSVGRDSTRRWACCEHTSVTRRNLLRGGFTRTRSRSTHDRSARAASRFGSAAGARGAGMRRVARLADGWIASAYNLTPTQVVVARVVLDEALREVGRPSAYFPCSLATMWTYVTESATGRDRHLAALGRMLGRDAEALYGQLLVGSAEHCAEVLRSYRAAGIERVFVWPLAEPESQLRRVMLDVAPMVDGT